jgi:hypothetical protein
MTRATRRQPASGRRRRHCCESSARRLWHDLSATDCRGAAWLPFSSADRVQAQTCAAANLRHSVLTPPPSPPPGRAASPMAQAAGGAGHARRPVALCCGARRHPHGAGVHHPLPAAADRGRLPGRAGAAGPATRRAKRRGGGGAAGKPRGGCHGGRPRRRGRPSANGGARINSRQPCHVPGERRLGLVGRSKRMRFARGMPWRRLPTPTSPDLTTTPTRPPPLVPKVTLASVMLAPRIASEAAQAALEAFASDDPLQRAAAIQAARRGAGAAHDAGAAVAPPSANAQDGGDGALEPPATPPDPAGAIPPAHARAAAALALAAAAVRAKCMADEQEAEIERLVQAVTKAQLTRVRTKLKYLQEINQVGGQRRRRCCCWSFAAACCEGRRRLLPRQLLLPRPCCSLFCSRRRPRIYHTAWLFACSTPGFLHPPCPAPPSP